MVHFTVTSIFETRVDLGLIQPFLLYYVNPCCSYAIDAFLTLFSLMFVRKLVL